MDQLNIPHEEHQEVIDYLFVPDINSADPEERKLARRIRIDKRVLALARQQKVKEQIAPEKPKDKVTLLQLQLERSGEILKQLFTEAEEQVTNVRVANDSREVDRREQEGVSRDKILNQLRQDAEMSMEMFQDISSKWALVLQYNDPLHIHDELQNQKEKCEELIHQKDSVIVMLKHEIREAEAKFYTDQQSQNEDIRMLAKRVEKQVTIMRAAHSIELQNIEDVMIQERANMMDNNDKRWNEMYKRREEQELAISENKLVQRQEFEEVVAKVRIKHYEKIREVKISMERDCDTLQQEYEYVKACALTNSEKMDYNYQILRKRESENIIIKSNQKRMLNKLQDNINDLRKKILKYETKTNAQIRKLYNEIISLQKCIANEKTKSKTVSLANDKKYSEIWELNRVTASKLLDKILTIDKLLCEQQLGITWEEPHIKLQIKEKLPSYKAAAKVVEVRKSKRSEIKIPTPDEVNSEVEMTIGYRRILRNVLERVADKSGFLIESKMKSIISNTTPEEGVLVKVDNVFEALGVEAVEDVNMMLQFFRPYIRCPLCTENVDRDKDDELDALSTNTSMSQTFPSDAFLMDAQTYDQELNTLSIMESDNAVDNIVASIVDPKRLKDSSSALELIKKDGECLGPTKPSTEVEKKVTQVVDYVTVIGDSGSTNCLINHPLYMNPASVLRALREFVSKVMCQGEEREMRAVDPDLSKTTQTISRLMNQTEVKDYWERYKAILAARTSELWEALFYGLQKYHAILEDRHKVNEDLKCLQKQNAELKFLLKRFKDENMKPPCAVERKSFEVMPRKYTRDCH